MVLHFQASGPLLDVLRTGLTPTYQYFRTKRPETAADQTNIYLAPANSYRYFYLRLGFKPKNPHLQGSFAEQYEQNQGEYCEYLDEGMDPVLQKPACDWRRGYDDWECAWDTWGARYWGCIICEQRRGV